MTPREYRRTIGWSMARVAGAVGVAIETVKTYELNRLAVSEKKRAQLDAFYREGAQDALT